MSANKDDEKKGNRVLAVFRIVLHLCIHKMIGIVVYQVIRVATLELTIPKFQNHIIFSVLGYQLLMVESILTFNKESSWVRYFSRPTVRKIHLALASLGCIFTVTGASLIISYRGGVFDTAHGVCGLIALIMSLISPLGGILTYFSPKLRNKVKPAVIKAVHTVAGMMTVTMGLVTLMIGINKQYFTAGVQNNAVGPTLISFVVIILLYTLWHPVRNMFDYVKNMRTTEL